MAEALALMRNALVGTQKAAVASSIAAEEIEADLEVWKRASPSRLTGKAHGCNRQPFSGVGS